MTSIFYAEKPLSSSFLFCFPVDPMCNCAFESVVQYCLKLGETDHREVNPLPIVTQRQSWGWNAGLPPQPGGCPAGGGGLAARRLPGHPRLLGCQHGRERQTRQTERHAQCSAWAAKPVRQARWAATCMSAPAERVETSHVRILSLSTCQTCLCTVQLRPQDSPYRWALRAPFYRGGN